MTIDNTKALSKRKARSKTADNQPRIGRPTREEAKRRQENLLEVALDMFLERGFEETTVEDIATAARMSKRTVYARYANKDELFVAAVHRAREHYTIPLEELQLRESDDLAATLKSVAMRRFENIAAPVGQRMFRVLTTQAYRFPELTLTAFNEGAEPAFEHLCKVFERFEAKGEVEIEDHRKAAAAFLSMTLGPAARVVTTGNQLDPKEFEDRVDFAVRLFINGIKKR